VLQVYAQHFLDQRTLNCYLWSVLLCGADTEIWSM
jgi:hypothetical protein